MSEHIVKVLEAQFITRDVKRFVVEKPDEYYFIPGQATDVSINLPGWEKQLHPFTFTSLNQWPYLEFMIKIYMEHPGITHMLSRVNIGGELILHDVFGAIEYKGPGVFIAAGSGITPFLSIFRALHISKQIEGNKLIYSNKTASDVIVHDELKEMLKDNLVNIFTREHNMGFLSRRIDRDFLLAHVSDFSQYFYVCGPDSFVADIQNLLFDLGVSPQSLIIEK
ncbi:MAG: flavodoxin reductase [Bacteroidota bacterium]|nr:flavodoxin reductase [Bacteroidota bacterium]